MQELKIHFLNTIWSDAIILETNGHFGFVDTGSSFYYPMIKEHLKDYNIQKLDFIILTHFHSDHYGNIKSIIENYQVSNLYLKHYYGIEGSTASGHERDEEYINKELETYKNIIEVANSHKVNIIYLDDFNTNMQIVNFYDINLELYDVNNRLYEIYNNKNSEFYHKNCFSENFNSIGIFIKINEHNIFLGGDVTCSKTDITELKALSIKMMEQIYQNHNINNIDIYKSCHHGGTGTNTLELCNLLKAKYAIITNTARWLDTYDTYENLKNANPKVLILPTDFQKYIFTINNNITYKIIKEDSLFITLNKN